MRLFATTAVAVLLVAATAGAAGAKDAPESLDGMYRLVAVVGRPAPDDRDGKRFVFSGGRIDATAVSAEPVEFATDATQTPARIDVATGDARRLGLYEWTESGGEPVLKVALGKPGGPRPTGFGGAGEGEVVFTLQKVGFFGRVGSIVVTLVDPRNLSHPEKFQKALNQPGVYWAALVAVTLIVFTETGLLIGFLLPGDSLLVVLGIVAQLSGWNLLPFLVCLIAAAIIGDAVGYWIGWKAGPAIFNRPSSRFFKQEYLQRARAFYEKHGGKTIIIARFVPIVRTFVPVVAGAARMEFRTFVSYNVFGGIGWIVSMILFGYYLIPIANPPMQSLLGDPSFTWAKHIDKVVLVVVFLSIVPILWKAAKHWLDGRKPETAAVTAVEPPEPAEPVAPAPTEDAPKSAV